METKLSKLVASAKAGDWQNALRIAAKFPSLGEQRTAILRAHEVANNPGFYRQIGHDPAELIDAGIAALKQRYPKQLATLIDGDLTMTDTKLTAPEIAKLTAKLTGGGYKRANSKEAAIKRFQTVAAESGVKNADAILAAASFEDAIAALDKTPEPPKMGGKAKQIAAVKGEPEAKAPKAPKADKPIGQRAAMKAAALEAAQRGELPTAPDFSPPSHAPFRKRLANIVAMIEAGDIKGLKADDTEPKSSSRVMICRYRDLAVIALEAKRKMN